MSERRTRGRPTWGEYLRDRLAERGTRRGLMWVFTGLLALSFRDHLDIVGTILSTGALVIGGYQAATPDDNRRTGFEETRETDY